MTSEAAAPLPSPPMAAVNAVLESLGRALVCVGPDFRVVHASKGLDELADDGAQEAIVGAPVESVLGAELFGADGSLRRALEAGERREGWGATLTVGEQRRLVSISAAPLRPEPGAGCDPRVAYLIVLRPAEEREETGTAAPTIFAGLIARSASMLRIFQLVQRLEESTATVLVTGESGTGKELLARAIHLHSPCRKGPFVPVNCGALPEQLLESELFGHVRGAFTGAVRDRQGRFEAAAGGSVFLDEVGDLPLHLQVKLLRVLQERTFERVGETASRKSDARIVAATNRDLKRAVVEGDFRDDLYYRLRVVPIHVPPLRERREDVQPLARFLLNRIGGRYGRSLRLSPEAMRALLAYAWPGNVRELENALEYATAVCRGQTIRLEDLPVEVGGGETRPPAPPLEAAPARPDPAGSPEGAPSEETLIREALEAHRWRRSAAAAALGISRTTLWRKMRELGLLDS